MFLNLFEQVIFKIAKITVKSNAITHPNNVIVNVTKVEIEIFNALILLKY